MREEAVVLVDTNDREVGIAPKLVTHRRGDLHRAVSVFIVNGAGEMLLQRRAEGKYHSEGLWSTACCTHPRPGESASRAASRRLHEEMGISCSLEHAFSFIYRASLAEGLTEHELDHVFIGVHGSDPVPESEEVEDWRWVSMMELERELESEPDRFTIWFPLALRRLMETMEFEVATHR